MDAKNLAGHFLIAMPGLDDDYFSQTLTYLFEHDKNGAMGLVVNRACDMTFTEILDQLGINVTSPIVDHIEVLYGGPINPDRGLVLHDGGNHWDSNLTISDQLSITSSKDILVDMANGNGPKNATLLLGYAGWIPNQLEDELLDNAWLVSDACPDLIFSTARSERLSKATSSLGIHYTQLSQDIGHA